MSVNNIAILLVSIDRPELEPHHPNDGVKYQRLFQIAFPEARFKIYTVIKGGDLPKNIHDYDLYFITGSRFSAYDKLDWVIKLKTFIRQLDYHKKRLVGICFGHQVIAEALGGKVVKSDKGWGLGMKSVTFNQQPWMKSPGKLSLNIPHIHQDQVVKLPDNAQLIAGDDFCPNASYTIGNHILTLQGHPEFSVDYLKAFFPVIKDRFPEDLYQQALDNIDQPHDGETFAHWVKHFTEQS